MFPGVAHATCQDLVVVVQNVNFNYLEYFVMVLKLLRRVLRIVLFTVNLHFLFSLFLSVNHLKLILLALFFESELCWIVTSGGKLGFDLIDSR